MAAMKAEADAAADSDQEEEQGERGEQGGASESAPAHVEG